MNNWKDLLKRLKLEHIKATAPGFFELSGGYQMKVKPYRDNTANGLTACIEDFINYIGEGEASRINSTGTPRMINGVIKWSKSNTRNGLADVRGTYRGRSISVEVKIGRDRQSEAQIKEMQRIRRAGGIYIIATSFPQFLNEFTAYFPDVIEKLQGYGFAINNHPFENNKKLQKWD